MGLHGPKRTLALFTKEGPEMLDVKLKNYRETTSTGGVAKEELDVIKAILFEILSKGGIPERGTFLLRTQTIQQERSGICDFKQILSFNFSRGEKKHFLGDCRGSDVMANWTLNDAVTYSRQTEMGGTIRFGYNQPAWMTVETTAGRFVGIFLADNGDSHTQEKVYLTIPKILAMLCPNDEVLQNVVGYTFYEVFEDALWVTDLEREIEEMFKREQLTEIKTWKKWRERHKDRIFFQ